MAFSVNTGYLRGYADQIDANRDNSLDYVKGYTGNHCRDYDRISGLMEPIQWWAEALSGMVLDNVFPDREHGLSATAAGLRRTANQYDSTDRSSEILLNGIDGQSPLGASKPGGSAGPFSAGAQLSLTAPKDENLTEAAFERIEAQVGDVTDVIKKVTGYDVVGEWAPVLLGDWGALYRLAEAWGQVGHGFNVIADDLDTGMATLLQNWQADGPSGAAPAFEKHMRTRIIMGFQVFGQLADMNREGFEFAAISYEAVITNGLWLLEYYGVRFRGVVKKVVKAMREVTLNPKTWYDLIDELVSIVEDYIDFIKNTVTAFEICVKQLIEMIELGVADMKTAVMLLQWKVAMA
jgi:hypothetical protein